jgi:hypothetical protein
LKVSRNDDNAVAPLLRHAKKFGTDGVMEAAVEARLELDLDFDALVRLREELDEIEKKPQRRFDTPKTHRLSAELRVKRLLGIPDEEESDAERE